MATISVLLGGGKRGNIPQSPKGSPTSLEKGKKKKIVLGEEEESA